MGDSQDELDLMFAADGVACAFGQGMKARHIQRHGDGRCPTFAWAHHGRQGAGHQCVDLCITIAQGIFAPNDVSHWLDRVRLGDCQALRHINRNRLDRPILHRHLDYRAHGVKRCVARHCIGRGASRQRHGGRQDQGGGCEQTDHCLPPCRAKRSCWAMGQKWCPLIGSWGDTALCPRRKRDIARTDQRNCKGNLRSELWQIFDRCAGCGGVPLSQRRARPIVA